MKRMSRMLAMLVCAVGVTAVQAQGVPQMPRVGMQAPRATPNDFWVSLGGGGYEGNDYERPAGEPVDPNEPDRYDVGGYAMHGSLNLAAGPTLMRLRASWMLDYTSNTAEEVAYTVGVPLMPGRKMFLAVGVSRLTDVSDKQQSPTIGVPIELIGYPLRGMELMLHGNINDDSEFIGVALSGVIGRDRYR